MYVFFFFQAEDGIRDLTVTGVQTCALPISPERCPHQASGSAQSRVPRCGGREKVSRSVQSTASAVLAVLNWGGVGGSRRPSPNPAGIFRGGPRGLSLSPGPAAQPEGGPALRR